MRRAIWSPCSLPAPHDTYAVIVIVIDSGSLDDTGSHVATARVK